MLLLVCKVSMSLLFPCEKVHIPNVASSCTELEWDCSVAQHTGRLEQWSSWGCAAALPSADFA